MMKKWMLLAFCLLIACSESGVNESTPRGTLLDYTEVTTLTEDDLSTVFPETSIDIEAEYEVTLYSITYASIYDGEPIVLSGMVIVPDVDAPIPHYQYHHGTLLPFASDEGEGSGDTPSLYEGGAPVGQTNQKRDILVFILPHKEPLFLCQIMPDMVRVMM